MRPTGARYRALIRRYEPHGVERPPGPHGDVGCSETIALRHRRGRSAFVREGVHASHGGLAPVN